ncbi:putative membrane protein [Propionispora sp. 2/2-37]|uniref:permease n=1 Tax=Propionispora sp. 2/2-37 TaxID=1677858 RepID=UPI0006BF50A9|nr:permease [Propionispora sp. 2/2-37]CUH94989.1 putative membrane protein [Propionispora sp. 2/2-37]
MLVALFSSLFYRRGTALDDLFFFTSYYLHSIDWSKLINFKIILFSILIEAFPFILLSVLLSALINNFVSEDILQRFTPKNKLLGLFLASGIGIFFPVCDCGMVPIVRRLIAKGVPLYFAVTFMLAVPIINPVVGAATGFAFNGNSTVVIYRLAAAFFTACLTGILLGSFWGRNALRQGDHASDNPGHCGCHSLPASRRLSITGKLIQTLRDAGDEFFEMGKYLLLGAMLSALFQILLPREVLLPLGSHPLFSIAFMMLFAFGSSVCSSADAFIAASFSNSFSLGSLIAFMVFGPMIDAKNLLMLLHAFRPRFVVTLTAVAAVLCAGLSYLINIL